MCALSASVKIILTIFWHFFVALSLIVVSVWAIIIELFCVFTNYTNRFELYNAWENVLDGYSMYLLYLYNKRNEWTTTSDRFLSKNIDSIGESFDRQHTKWFLNKKIKQNASRKKQIHIQCKTDLNDLNIVQMVVAPCSVVAFFTE